MIIDPFSFWIGALFGSAVLFAAFIGMKGSGGAE
jgi:hypothetical protein